jgi:transcriptional regulator with XRE-family HTH domain
LPVYTTAVRDYSELRLGHTIREQRKSRGWTLHDLASRVGMSVAGLSEIETEKSVLDLERLVVIADALGVRPDSMFPKSHSRHFQVARRATIETLPPATLKLLDRSSGTITAHHNRLRPLADAFVGKHIEPFQVEVLPLPDADIRFISHHHEEFLFVLRGEVECLIKTPEGPAQETLAAGDCLYLLSNLPHCLRAVGGQPAHTIDIVHSPYNTADSEHGDTAIYFKDGIPKNLTEQIADQIAALREARGLSTTEFARELDISVRQLADVERGRKAVSIDLLLRACRRFRKPLEYFLSRTAVHPPFYFIQRASDIGRLPVRTRRRLVDKGWADTQFRSLASGFFPRGMHPYYVKIRDPGPDDITLHEHHGQEFVYVLTGEVTLITVLDGKRVRERLSAGDTCFVDSTVPHRFVGEGLSPYDDSSAELIDVYWCPLGEGYLFEEDTPEVSPSVTITAAPH